MKQLHKLFKFIKKCYYVLPTIFKITDRSIKSIELAKQMQNFKTIEDFLSIVKGVPDSEMPSFVAASIALVDSTLSTSVFFVCIDSVLADELEFVSLFE
ncbi:Protein of unknown function [Cotesia congregata]|uniref:Uncharacterized protein n=1 Tax=Cotesia congregata TaxID=51543 RepID=A0A8J2HMP2_COTCN|nr:Protein of unknown function [Cotesia congregata]